MRSALVMVMALALGAAQAMAFELVSEAEVQAEQRALAERGPLPNVPRTRSISLGPRITVVTPGAADAALRTPLRIELRFQPNGEAKVNPASLKVLYGFLGVDLTAKLREHAQVSESGVLAEQARIPPGKHRLRVQISDTLGRTGETELRFQVND
ncbi:MAG: hypothetical protein J0L58_13635 [Burkholderiales bacterium]|nr:hypothetical protein [Burkholderiales bacterium]